MAAPKGNGDPFRRHPTRHRGIVYRLRDGERGRITAMRVATTSRLAVPRRRPLQSRPNCEARRLAASVSSLRRRPASPRSQNGGLRTNDAFAGARVRTTEGAWITC